jgi:integrase
MTKTGRARRVSIDPGTVQALRDHAERQAKDREVVGGGWPDTDLVFRMEIGGPLRVDMPGELMRHTIARLNAEAETGDDAASLRAIRLHDLRHVHATLLLKAGVPVHVVAARLGHRDAAMTLRVYAHVLSDQATTAAAVFARFMGDDEGV